MAATWPLTLQQLLSEAEFAHKIGETTIRSDMEVGPAKVRRQYTKGVDTIDGSIYLTTAQYSTFYNFFNTTLAGGSLTFEFDHPITGVLTEFRFVGSPSVRSIGGGNFTVSFSWEEV